MRIGALAERVGVTAKAVRYYESLGLLAPARLPNGYRSYDESHVRILLEIRDLTGCGIPPSRAAPFVQCLQAGHRHGDECPAALATYRDRIAELDRTISVLNGLRADLAARLQSAAGTDVPQAQRLGTVGGDSGSSARTVADPVDSQDELLVGRHLSPLVLPAGRNRSVDLSDLGTGYTVLYLYPLTGSPGRDLPDGWDSIPGARGCTAQAGNLRDHIEVLRAAGVKQVYGLSSQSAEYQAELVRRLKLPFDMISDRRLQLAEMLQLPTFQVDGLRFYRRLTLIIAEGQIRHVFYPIDEPESHAQAIAHWLIENRDPASIRPPAGGSVPARSPVRWLRSEGAAG